MKKLEDLNVKIFADGADRSHMLALYEKAYIKGLTTNPTLIKQAGVQDYGAFCRGILTIIRNKPISFEVLCDDFGEMERQALEIASWGKNVYVKIPITNTKGESSIPLVKTLVQRRVKVNVTAIMTEAQVRNTVTALDKDVPGYISVFAGRIADTGRDPLPLMIQTVEMLRSAPTVELIWASSREFLNIFQADVIGCHVITVASDILKKIPLWGRDLTDYSLETVTTFYNDAVAAGLTV